MLPTNTHTHTARSLVDEQTKTVSVDVQLYVDRLARWFREDNKQSRTNTATAVSDAVSKTLYSVTSRRRATPRRPFTTRKVKKNIALNFCLIFTSN